MTLDDHGVEAIVLAGGRSARFGRDKLAEPIDGQPLLRHAISAVGVVADRVVVVAAPGTVTLAIDDLDRVSIVHDPRPHEGPLAGLATGLAVVRVDRVIVVAGDMPSLVPAVLRRLLAALDPEVEAAVLGSERGAVPLPMALRATTGRAAAGALLAGGERRLRALPDALRTTVIPEPEWRLDDPEAATLRDIDVPGDIPLTNPGVASDA
ncbi:MAG TPA: NTP transferase domain-containing protein [Candidatus Saccharimonadales bacterium]|nr:NTP transferase domain-containing protein [Candidatus Saccharimonadales bacterium]